MNMGPWGQGSFFVGALLLTSVTGFPEARKEGFRSKANLQLAASSPNIRSLHARGPQPSFKEKASTKKQMRECGEGSQTVLKAKTAEHS